MADLRQLDPALVRERHLQPTEVALAALILGRNALATKMYQGRFLFPSIGPLMLLTTTGLFVMWPSRLAVLFWPAVVVVMIAVNLILWLTGILPIYYQPWLG